MKIAWSSGLSDQNLVTNPQGYKDRQNRSSLLSISMELNLSERDLDSFLCYGYNPILFVNLLL